jgi:hypothetical protein
VDPGERTIVSEGARSGPRNETTMRELASRVQDWRAAGLVSPEQAEAIIAFESVQAAPTAPRRTVIAEAIGYVGAALAVGAVGMIVGNLWDELTTGPRLVLVGLLVLLLGGAGFALGRVDRAPLQRLASVLLTGAVAGVGWFAAIIATDLASLDGGEIGLTIGGAAFVVALPLYLTRPRALHQLTVLVTVLVVAVSALTLAPMELDPTWFGVTVSAIGVAWFVLAFGGWLVPRLLGEVAGSVLAIFALQVTGRMEEVWPLFVAIAFAAGLIVLAILADHLHHLVVGAVGLFVIVPQLVIRLFGDTLSAPAILLIVGLLLVLLAVGIGRARREVGGVSPTPSPPAGGAPDAAPTLDGTTPTAREEARR